MSNKRTAERQLRPVFEPSAELVAFCQHVTRAAVNAYEPNQLREWFSSPAMLHYVRRNGTPFAYQALTDALYRQFVEGDFSWINVVSLLKQGAFVPDMTRMGSWFECAHHGHFNMHVEEDEEDEDGPDGEEQHRHNQELRAFIRNAIPAAAEVMVNKTCLPWMGGAPAPDVQCPLFGFIRRVHCILCSSPESDTDAKALRPMFWDLLATLVDRKFDFDVGDINGDTPRSFLEQWDSVQAARLFDPVILK